MNRDEFERLRDLPNKMISSDIEFTPTGSNPDVLKFEEKIDNPLGLEIIVTGNYKKMIPSLTFNFHVTGVGAICRFDINGKLHPDANTLKLARTHKHSLQTDSCPKDNLPYAIERNFDLVTQTVIDIWKQICFEASINHNGVLIIQ